MGYPSERSRNTPTRLLVLNGRRPASRVLLTGKLRLLSMRVSTSARPTAFGFQNAWRVTWRFYSISGDACLRSQDASMLCSPAFVNVL